MHVSNSYKLLHFLEIEGAVSAANAAVDTAVQYGVKQIQANGNSFRTDVENNGNKISQVVTQQIANAQNTIDKTTKNLEKQIKESIERLGKMIS